jgi:hypothetical protein
MLEKSRLQAEALLSCCGLPSHLIPRQAGSLYHDQLGIWAGLDIGDHRFWPDNVEVPLVEPMADTIDVQLHPAPDDDVDLDSYAVVMLLLS